MSRRAALVLHIADGSIEYLFDFVAGLPPRATTSSSNVPDDRVVTVYGFSRRPKGLGDTSRMRGFLGGGLGRSAGPVGRKGTSPVTPRAADWTSTSSRSGPI